MQDKPSKEAYACAEKCFALIANQSWKMPVVNEIQQALSAAYVRGRKDAMDK